MRQLQRAFAAVAVLFLTGCEGGRSVEASGKIAKREMDLRNFDYVEVSSAIEADLRQGKEFSVEIEADEAAMPYLDVRTRGDRLVIATKGFGSFRDIQIRATVTMPKLKGLTASGASRVTLDDFASDDRLEIESSGASKIEGDLDAGDTRVNASGASNVKLNGHGAKLRAEASGASHLDLADFHVEDADINASGASTVSTGPKGRLDADASGASHITYYGSPQLGRAQSSGGASIKAGD